MEEEINNIKEFAEKIVRYQTYKPRGKPPLEIKGKIEYHQSQRDGKQYSFNTDFEIKTSVADTIKQYCLSLDYINPHGDEHNELEEINLYLEEIKNNIQKTLENPKFFIQRSLKDKTLETKLDKKDGLLIIFPFQ
jgi:hypothetical protein